MYDFLSDGEQKEIWRNVLFSDVFIYNKSQQVWFPKILLLCLKTFRGVIMTDYPNF